MEIDNFKLSEEQSMILETVRRFVSEQIEPKALEWDEHCTFVRASFDGLSELGMLGIPLPEASGGAEMGLLSFVVALEEIGRVCGSSARVLLSQTALCGMALEGHAGAEDIAMGESLGAFIGLDSGITAAESGDGFVLNGTAAMVTAATEANQFVIAASTTEGETILFLVAAEAVTTELVHALGFRASAPGRVILDNVATSADGLIVRGDAATATLGRVHIAACIGGGAIAVGMADASRRHAAVHAGERFAFGKPLAKQQAVALKLGDSLCATEAARHLVYHAARLAEGGQEARTAGNMARVAAVESAIAASDEAIQILGGYGFTVEYHVERFYRDAQTLQVLGGGNEALRNELARAAL
jgi:alkylation response protein AidB-like acyl-CoA dehydrogenase